MWTEPVIVDSSLIEASIARAKRHKTNLKELGEKIKDGDRTSYVTPEEKKRRLQQFLSETKDQASAYQALERMLGGNDISPISYLEKGVNAARPVCRIHLKNSSGDTIGFGTGFLVAPGVLMTNHHVIGGIEDAKYALAEFNYELDICGKEKPVVTFAILADPAPIAIKQLDFCLASVSAKSDDEKYSLSEFGWLSLSPDPAKTTIGEYLTIHQHPAGGRKQTCVRENKLLRYDPEGDTIWYCTDTLAGSSGSPVFNNSWQVVALHHMGVPKMDEQGHYLTVDNKVWDKSMDESLIKWEANEGIRISRIMTYLSQNFGEHPLAKAILAQPISSLPTEAQLPSSKGQYSEYADGELRVTIPVQISVRVGEQLANAGKPISKIAGGMPTAATVGAQSVPNDMTGVIEKVEVDQSNYVSRTGYDPAFLGDGALLVPLPKVRDEKLKQEVLLFTYQNVEGPEVKYWNYSLIMHKSRKLAIYSAVNVDANQRPAGAGRDGDRWYSDPRVGDENQIGNEFYKGQSTFEADRSKNPFDKGHLTRRLDAQWGQDDETSSRNGNDSFHWTNCSPQHWQLNQGSKRWLGLEDYVIKTFAKDTGQACVINGPVFDAPLSHKGQDGRIIPDIEGKTHTDPIFGNVAIPKLFYKMVACKGENNQLRVAAFLMSQEDLLQTIDRIQGMPPSPEEILTPAEAKIYQIKLKDLEKLTGLDFGPLSDVEVPVEEKEVSRVRIIEDLDDIHI